MANRLKLLGTESGAKLQDVEYFSTDLQTNEDAKLTIVVSALADDVQITLDSGATWVDLIGALTANTHTQFSVTVGGGDLINFRSNDAGGTTLDYFRVYMET